MRGQTTIVLVPKRALLAALAAVALLAAPVAAVEAKRDGPKASPGGGGGKRCEKPKRLGFKVSGTFDDYVDSNLTVEVTRANRHARRWLGVNLPTSATFDTSGARKIKFVGVTDTMPLNGTVGFEDAVDTDRVKLKAKLVKPKRGCDGAEELRVKRIKVKRPDAA